MRQQTLFIVLLFFVSAMANCQVSMNEKFEKSWNTSDTIEKRMLREDIAVKSPDSEYGLFCRAWFLTLKSDNVAALEMYSKAIELKSDFWQAYNNRGILYAGLADYDKAVTDYTKTIELNPVFADAYINRGILYQNLKDYTKAISDYNKAISINPNDAETYYNRGITYLYSGDLSGSISDFNKAIEINPAFGGAYYNRGGAYYSTGNKTKACEDWNLAYKFGIMDAKEALNRFCK